MDPAEEERWNAEALSGAIALPAVRVWSYTGAALVLGRSQRADEALRERARRAGVGVCERATGGGAVLAGPWLLAASVVLPPEHPLVAPSIPASYRWLGEVHAALLPGASLIAAPVDGGELRWACFAGLSHGEVVIGGRKIVGLAQARRRAGVLFSSGLLVGDTPWRTLCAVMDRPPGEAAALAERTTSWPGVSAAELHARLRAAVAP